MNFSLAAFILISALGGRLEPIPIHIGVVVVAGEWHHVDWDADLAGFEDVCAVDAAEVEGDVPGEADEVTGLSLIPGDGVGGVPLGGGVGPGVGGSGGEQHVSGEAGVVPSDDALAGVECASAAGAAVVSAPPHT
jgi:hypothetical protein